MTATAEIELSEELTVLRKEVKLLRASSTQSKPAEDECSHFFTHSLDLLCIAGFDGYFKRLNPTWTSCLGWTLEELTARPFLDLVHPDDIEATRLQFDAAMEGAETVRFENRYRHNDGSFRWLRWNARSVPDLQWIYANARDVTQQKLLEKMFLEIVDTQKERFAFELHDGLCQTLAGIAALSTTLAKKLEFCSEFDAAGEAREISTLLNEAVVEAHDLARDLGPIASGRGALEATLQALAKNVHERFGVPCAFECDCIMDELDHKVEGQLYRIAQEAVSNAVNHSCASLIEISLSSKGEKGLLSIRDDGVGMPELTGTAEGVGMHSMDYRSRLIGGHLELNPRTPRGTAINCVFPLARSSSGVGRRYDRDET